MYSVPNRVNQFNCVVKTELRKVRVESEGEIVTNAYMMIFL